MTDRKDQQKLKAAIELGYLNEFQSEQIAKEQKESNYPAIEVAIRRGFLNRQQLDVLEAFCNPMDVVPGYRIEGMLGSGGAGTVYKATQLRMDRSVAIKTINEAAARNELMPKRFEREARIVGQLQHPNIISAIDFGVHKGQLYLVMEFVDGIDAEKYLNEKTRISESLVWYMALQVCHALDSANQVGIIHRDMKPANMILSESPPGSKIPANVPFVKVADFGLAKFKENQHDSTITMENSVSGTPYYMSPEQVRATDVDHRSDIYSLGITIWHLVEGAPPISGNSPLDVITNKMQLEDSWLSDQPASISDSGFRLLRRMCRHDRDERIQDYGELNSEIEEVIKSFNSSSAATQDFDIGQHSVFTASAKVTTIKDLSSTISDRGDTDNASSQRHQSRIPVGKADNTPHDPDSASQSIRRIIPIGVAIIVCIGLLLGSFFLWGDPAKEEAAGSGNRSAAREIQKSFDRLSDFAGLPIPLFNGLEMDPTQKFTGLWDVADGGEGGTVMAGKDGTRNFRCVNLEKEPLANFRFECGFRHHESEVIAFRGLDAESKNHFELNISEDEAILFTGSGSEVGRQPLRMFDDNSFGYHLCRIESQPEHWRIEVDSKLVGEVPKSADDRLPTTIQLATIGSGWGHFESVQVQQLK